MTIHLCVNSQQDRPSFKDLNVYRPVAREDRQSLTVQRALSLQGLNSLTYQDGSVMIGSIAVHMARRPLGDRLVRAFFTKNEQYLDRDTLLMSVYGRSMSSVSARQAASLHASLCKLISRTRRYLIACSAPHLSGSKLDWLSYCHQRQKWFLVR